MKSGGRTRVQSDAPCNLPVRELVAEGSRPSAYACSTIQRYSVQLARPQGDAMVALAAHHEHSVAAEFRRAVVEHLDREAAALELRQGLRCTTQRRGSRELLHGARVADARQSELRPRRCLPGA